MDDLILWLAAAGMLGSSLLSVWLAYRLDRATDVARASACTCGERVNIHAAKIAVMETRLSDCQQEVIVLRGMIRQMAGEAVGRG